MAQAHTIPETTLPSGRSLRIVLFGMPNAGKSSLLGALAQAARTQEHILNGQLIDKSQQLLELQRRLYEDRPRETLEEVAPFEVLLQPYGGKGGAAPPPAVPATLVDCDGRVANKLLANEKLTGTSRDGVLARAVLDADTLVLVIDASTNPPALKRDFAQFAKFLRVLEEGRGDRTEVGGLPVYLVLTKCDLLAQKGDTSAAWMERIEERKREVSQSFREFLAEQEAGRVPFGKVGLNLWATAVKRPALADAPARPLEPYGVAELFRQCLESAATYREQRRFAARRLTVTLAAVLGVVAAMVLLTLVLVWIQPTPGTTALEEEVSSFRAANDSPAKRLSGPIDEKITQLQKIEASPDFPRLAVVDQERVQRDLNELTAFRAYREKLHAITDGFNGDLNNLKDDVEPKLALIRQKLEELPVPAGYVKSWEGIPDVKQHRQWKNDLKKFFEEKEARFGAQGDYEKLDLQARPLASKIIEKGQDPVLKAEAVELLKRARDLPGAPEPGGGSKDAKKLIPGTELRYELLFRLPSVQRTLNRWWKESPAREVLEKAIN